MIIKLLKDDSGTQANYTRKCMNCNHTESRLVKYPTWTLPVRNVQQSLSTEIKHRFNRVSEQACQHCGVTKVHEIHTLNVNNPPPFIALNMEDRRDIGEGICQPKLTSQVTIGERSDKVTYKVRGLIYWDKSHFTCRMLGKSSEAYYNDGVTLGNQ